jgi:hypothetical protein
MEEAKIPGFEKDQPVIELASNNMRIFNNRVTLGAGNKFQ